VLIPGKSPCERRRYDRCHPLVQGAPFLGTCGGFQYVVIELACNVLGIRNAERAEPSSNANELFVVPLACLLVRQQQQIEIRPDTIAARPYNTTESTELFFFSYGLNPSRSAPVLRPQAPARRKRTVHSMGNSELTGLLYVYRGRNDSPRP